MGCTYRVTTYVWTYVTSGVTGTPFPIRAADLKIDPIFGSYWPITITANNNQETTMNEFDRPEVEHHAADDWCMPTAPAKEQTVETPADQGTGRETPKFPSKRSRGFTLTARDLIVLRYVGRHVCPTYLHISYSTDVPYKVLKNRFVHFRRAGLVREFEAHDCGLKLWALDTAGAELCGLDSSMVLKENPVTVRHRLGLIGLCDRFEASGEVVLTEREYRQRVIDRHASKVDGIPDRLSTAMMKEERKHIPDLVILRDPINGAPQSIALELELHHKRPVLILEKLRWYARSETFGAVIYYVQNQKVRGLLERCIRESRTQDKISIRDFVSGPESGIWAYCE